VEERSWVGMHGMGWRHGVGVMVGDGVVRMEGAMSDSADMQGRETYKVSGCV
jgi:hypothetical protein